MGSAVSCPKRYVDHFIRDYLVIANLNRNIDDTMRSGAPFTNMD